MQSPSTMPDVPFRQKLHKGQRRVIDALEDHPDYLNVQLPTGYGKTFTAACCYSVLQHAGQVNRLLVIFPSDGQLAQFEADSPSDQSDLVQAAIEGPRYVVDLRFEGAQAIQKHRMNTHQVFAITVQALLQARGNDNVRLLMQTGRWMIVVDEYHHYGLDKAWGRTVRSLPSTFLLAMSATPTRPNNDSAFGPPHVQVSYREAAEERVVKPLRGHAYHYLIDALTPDGNVRTFTTAELVEEAGTDSPEALERWRIERKMRWSPKYVSPLVSTPIERMLHARITSGHRLQVLIGAMCVSHAELVCEQVRSMYDELRVDWVGTGPNGRTDAKNKEVLRQFCPPKDEDGHRHPELDVLVHVGIAGEGLDSIYVTEVVHLNRANKNNSNDQENGRAARRLTDDDGNLIEGNINFDATSEYAKWVGDNIMDAMDGQEPTNQEPIEPGSRDPFDFDPFPEEPTIHIYNMELDHIDSGDPGVQRMAAALAKQTKGFSLDDYSDPASPAHELLFREYREMRRREAEAHNAKSIVAQWKDAVDLYLSAITHRVIRLMSRGGQRVERSLAGDIKRRINSRKRFALGAVANDVEVYKQHYQWLHQLERQIIDEGIPLWLS